MVVGGAGGGGVALTVHLHAPGQTRIAHVQNGHRDLRSDLFQLQLAGAAPPAPNTAPSLPAQAWDSPDAAGMEAQSAKKNEQKKTKC